MLTRAGREAPLRSRSTPQVPPALASFPPPRPMLRRNGRTPHWFACCAGSRIVAAAPWRPNDIFAGVELSDTECVAILARGPDDVLARETLPTTSPEETLGRIEEILANWHFRAWVRRAGHRQLRPDQPRRGLRRPRRNHQHAETRLARRAGARPPRPCDSRAETAFDTDVNGAALAEMRWGSGRGFDDFAYVHCRQPASASG